MMRRKRENGEMREGSMQAHTYAKATFSSFLPFRMGRLGFRSPHANTSWLTTQCKCKVIMWACNCVAATKKLWLVTARAAGPNSESSTMEDMDGPWIRRYRARCRLDVYFIHSWLRFEKPYHPHVSPSCVVKAASSMVCVILVKDPSKRAAAIHLIY